MIYVGDIIYSEDETRYSFAIVDEICDDFYKVSFINGEGSLSSGTVPQWAVKKVWTNPETVQKMLCHIGKGVIEHGFSKTSAKCEYCGKPYNKKKKAQRFCCIKCKDKWWNRERSDEWGVGYPHPQCEDNFNGDW